MEKTKIIEVANKLLEYIVTISAGTEIATSEAITAVYGTTRIMTVLLTVKY